ncbi:MAG: glucose-1-phosphate adenylyltransferase [Planctomycetota bacterium]
MMRRKILGMIMAGGKGERLHPLTRDRAKPAVPFGGKYRIIDYVLSNFVNSGICSIYVLTQFKSQSLVEHLEQAWMMKSFFRDQFISVVPAQMRTGESWYKGTADAINQNIHLIRNTKPDLVAVFGGDHIYRMDIRQMAQMHEEKKADVTVASLPVPVGESSRFGVVVVDEDWRITGFQEKPQTPIPLPGDSKHFLASMGNYIFNADFLLNILKSDASDSKSSHDFGKDILPAIHQAARIYAYDFTSNTIPGTPRGEKNTYWRDVGTIDAYWEASMDLRAVKPVFNLYNLDWPIRTMEYGGPPAKFVHESGDRVGRAINSMVCEESIISGGTVRDSIVGRCVRVHSFAEVSESVIMDNVEVGEGAKLKRVIVDKNVIIPAGAKIGFDVAEDRKHYTISEGGIVVIPRQRRIREVAELEI